MAVRAEYLEAALAEIAGTGLDSAQYLVVAAGIAQADFDNSTKHLFS